jgi:hypothetical protein
VRAPFLESAHPPFVLSLRQAQARVRCAYRSTNGSRRPGVEQFALRYPSANDDVEPIPAESDR